MRLYGLTIKTTVDSAIEMLTEYPTINTINLFSCWTGSPNQNEESTLLEDRLKLEDKSIQLSFAEKFIVELAKRAAAGEIEPERIANLTVVGCMGEVTSNISGRTQANKEVREPNFDGYATYSEDGTFVSINADKFLEKFNTLRNDIRDIKPAEKSVLTISEKSSKDISNSDSEDKIAPPSSNRFNSLRLSGDE